MPDFSISSLSMFLNQRRTLGDLQTRLTRSAVELSTGKKARPVRELGLDFGVLVQLRRQHDQISNYQRRIDLIDSRLDITQVSLTTINNGLDRLPEDIQSSAGRGDVTALLRHAAEGKNILARTISALNINVGGRYLFSGNEVQTQPLVAASTFTAQVGTLISGAPDLASGLTALDDFFGDVAPAGFTGTLYQAATGPAPIGEIAESERLTYGVKANEQPFRTLMQGLAMMSALAEGTVSLSGQDLQDFSSRAAVKIREGRDGITLKRADLGAVQAETTRTKSAHEATLTALGLRISALEGRDPNEAATQFQSLESQLQASYLITGRLAQLRLTNFI